MRYCSDSVWVFGHNIGIYNFTYVLVSAVTVTNEYVLVAILFLKPLPPSETISEPDFHVVISSTIFTYEKEIGERIRILY